VEKREKFFGISKIRPESGASKRGGSPSFLLSSPSPSRERGTEGVRVYKRAITNTS